MTTWNVYVGTFTAEQSDYLFGKASLGLEHMRFDDETGRLWHLETITGVVSPQYLALHPRLPVLYAAEFARPGRLSTFLIGPSGTLEAPARTASLGDLAVAVSIHPGGGYAYAANWGSGTVTAFPLDADGTVVATEPIPQREIGGRAVPVNDKSARPHQIRPTPNGNGVLVVYHGSDELTAYTCDPDGAVSSVPITTINFPDDSASRHVEFHPSGEWLYVVGERDSMLYVLEAAEGLPIRILKSYPTTPATFVGKNRTSELKLHPDGTALYVGNRGADCVTVFAVDDSGANLEIVGFDPTIGRGPRGLSVDPTGQYLLVGNTSSDDISVFEIDSSRRLHPVGMPVPTNSPSSLVFSLHS